MRYSTEPKFRKYVKGYGFLSFARKFGDKYDKTLMDTATKTGIDPAKTASKRVAQETEEAKGDLIGNKIVDKITSIGKSKEKEKLNKSEEIYIPPEKRQQIIDDLNYLNNHNNHINNHSNYNDYNDYNNHETNYFFIFHCHYHCHCHFLFFISIFQF